MKKKTLCSILFTAAAVLAAAFAALLTVDFFKFYEFGSAPFYVYILTRGIEFLLPAAICLIAGIIIKKKQKENQ